MLSFKKFLNVRIQMMTTVPSKMLETFPNPNPENDYTIHIEIPEFTCLCPKTGQPDFATLLINYIPNKDCLELKSLKLYIWSYRDKGAFHEAVTNQILKDLTSASKPRFMRLTSKFNVRGGILTSIVVEHKNEKWTPAGRINLP
jgi:7-cyano-7-deazaguanine reductase